MPVCPPAQAAATGHYSRSQHADSGSQTQDDLAQPEHHLQTTLKHGTDTHKDKYKTHNKTPAKHRQTLQQALLVLVPDMEQRQHSYQAQTHMRSIRLFFRCASAAMDYT